MNKLGSVTTGLGAIVAATAAVFGMSVSSSPAQAHDEYPVKGVIVHADAVSKCTMFELTQAGAEFYGAEDTLLATEQQLWGALQRCGVEIVD